jgi:pimeloyl-ACP methyl ester carboxylesterase
MAPDLRGFGRSSRPEATEDFAVENGVADMIALLDHLGVRYVM